jgi:hypothetical protein
MNATDLRQLPGDRAAVRAHSEVAGSVASTLATTGTTGGLTATPASLRHHIGGRLHQRAMEGRGYRQQHRALGPYLAIPPLDRRLVARHTTGCRHCRRRPVMALRGCGDRRCIESSRSTPPWRQRPPHRFHRPRTRNSRGVGRFTGDARAASLSNGRRQLRVAFEIETGFGFQHADGGLFSPPSAPAGRSR